MNVEQSAERNENIFYQSGIVQESTTYNLLY